MSRSSIESLYRHTFASLVDTAAAVLDNRADAEDLVQDLFALLLESDTGVPAGPRAQAVVLAQVQQPETPAQVPRDNVVPFVRPPMRKKRAA